MKNYAPNGLTYEAVQAILAANNLGFNEITPMAFSQSGALAEINIRGNGTIWIGWLSVYSDTTAIELNIKVWDYSSQSFVQAILNTQSPAGTNRYITDFFGIFNTFQQQQDLVTIGFYGWMCKVQ